MGNAARLGLKHNKSHSFTHPSFFVEMGNAARLGLKPILLLHILLSKHRRNGECSPTGIEN